MDVLSNKLQLSNAKLAIVKNYAKNLVESIKGLQENVNRLLASRVDALEEEIHEMRAHFEANKGYRQPVNPSGDRNPKNNDGFSVGGTFDLVQNNKTGNDSGLSNIAQAESMEEHPDELLVELRSTHQHNLSLADGNEAYYCAFVEITSLYALNLKNLNELAIKL